MNREIIRARTLIADLRLNNEKAHQLTHTLRNLLTVRRLVLEHFHRTAHPRAIGVKPKQVAPRSTPMICSALMNRQELEQKMEELTREYCKNQDPEIREHELELTRQLRELDP